jgi:serine/threonine-protein kinase
LNLGPYQLISKLAQGGMAEVFLARREGPRGFEKQLVVKRMRAQLAVEAEFVEMFLAEAKISAKLSHPGLPQIFDFGESNGSYFIAMEHVEGTDLRRLLTHAAEQGQALDPLLCARVISLACETLAYVHGFKDPSTGRELHLVHRDVSPENLVLTTQGQVKLLDFGIAKATAEKGQTRVGLIKGKLAYMPPEQLRAEALDRRTDIYALGACLFELVCGSPPYSSEGETAVMQAILVEPVPDIRSRRLDALPELQPVFDKALAKRPDDRYASCGELKSALEVVLKQHGAEIPSEDLGRLAASVPPVQGEAIAEPTLVRGAATAPESTPFIPDRSQPARMGRPSTVNWFESSPEQAQPPTEKLEFARPVADRGSIEVARVEPLSRPFTPSIGGFPTWILGVGFLMAALGGGYYAYTRHAGGAPLPAVERALSALAQSAPATLSTPAVPSPLHTILVDSEPEGAEVRLNNVVVGETPWVGQNDYRAGATVQVKVSHRGFVPWTGTVIGGQPAQLHPSLKRLAAPK